MVLLTMEDGGSITVGILTPTLIMYTLVLTNLLNLKVPGTTLMQLK